MPPSLFLSRGRSDHCNLLNVGVGDFLNGRNDIDGCQEESSDSRGYFCSGGGEGCSSGVDGFSGGVYGCTSRAYGRSSIVDCRSGVRNDGIDGALDVHNKVGECFVGVVRREGVKRYGRLAAINVCSAWEG